MKFLKIRVLPLFLVFVLSVSLLVVPAFASDFPSEFRDEYAVADWNSKLNTSNTMGLNALAEYLKVPASAYDIFWALVDGQVSNKAGEVNRSELEILASSYTGFFTNTLGNTFGEQLKNSYSDVFNDILARTLIGSWDPYFEVQQHPSSGLYRIKEMTTGLFVVDSAGRYPYAEASSEGFLGTDQWVPISAMDGGSFRMLSKEAIYNLADDVGGTAYTRGNYICIAKNASSGVVDKMVLANEDGKPYVCWKDKNQSATEQERPTTNVTENGNIVEGDDNSVNLDLEGMTMLLPGGTLAFIDQIIYDESTKSYHIDSHDTYNYEINNYYTWNYYINYTSITYIGQTEEYNKYYEVYYELPDGRSSADLTKEDLEQLNLSVDVIPYGRSADDTSLRSLYHFDGDTKDSSYWNYCTDFKWNKGASLTYMDAGVFNGALYLDETEHDFSLTLPSNIGSGDFTLQFRYYQSATAAPVTDSYVKIGGNVVVQFDGVNLMTHDGVVVSQMPVGSWNEIAIIRNGSSFKIYLNGVLCSSSNYLSSTPLNWDVLFHFGSSQQTFKYLDEVRVLNYALTSASAYTPTAVPYDTNLTLVLPDSQMPVADEYWSIKNDLQTNLLTQYGLDSYLNSANATSKYFTNCNAIFSTASNSAYGTYVRMGNSSISTTGEYNFPYFYRYGTYTSMIFTDEGMQLKDFGYSNSLSRTHFITLGSASAFSGAGEYSISPGAGMFTLLSYGRRTNEIFNIPAGTYTFTIVLSSGERESVTFDLRSRGTSTVTDKNGLNQTVLYESSVGGYQFGLMESYADLDATGGGNLKPASWLYIRPDARSVTGQPIIYMELVSGSSTSLECEWVESVTGIDRDSMNTPTLAVRTDIDITSYQIGGVRPSIPEKGQVWAMVENDRIVSIQIYNGQAWEGVDGRIWTGERWIPASSYNIITLQDLYDIVDATPNYEYIYSEAGFWAWWQKSWNAFTEKLFLALGSGGTGGGASGGVGSSELNKVDLDSAPVVSDPEQEDSKSLWQFIILVVDGGKSVVTGTRELFSGVVSTIPDTMDGITGAFDSGGIAVGIFDGSDPDAEDIESEVLDPWRYQ